MSLRKSPQLTPALLAAARNNAQHCTGPSSPAAKQNVKFNALKHGAYVRDENRCHALQALGEDPEKLQTLKEELMSAFGPGDALWEKQVEDLAWLYWRRDRLARAQQADEEEKQSLRKIGFLCDPPGEAEREELLRLLEEEIASVREEFEYAEKANEEAVAIERDACLEPEGETWSMMLRQEGALDRSIDRKVRILLRLRKEAGNLPVALRGQDDGARMENMDDAHDSDIMTERSQVPEAVEELKVKKQYGNIYEKKGSASSRPARSGNAIENTHSYAKTAGILLKRRDVGGMS